MSSHDTSVRGDLMVKRGTTLATVVRAMGVLLDGRSQLKKPGRLAKFGEAEMQDGCDSSVHLAEDGRLSFNLDVWGSGCGIEPDGVREFADAVGALMEGGGVIEVVDHDASAGSEDAMSAVFVGATERDRKSAQVLYGLKKAGQWWQSCMTPAQMAKAEAAVLKVALA